MMHAREQKGETLYTMLGERWVEDELEGSEL